MVTEENIRSAFGVDAVIGQIETPGNMLTNVIPLNIASEYSSASREEDCRSIATITIIANSNHMADKINGLLHEYGHLMVGRMGMPYRECGLYIINITLDGTVGEIRNLTHRLGLLPGVSAKATYARRDFQEERTW